MIEDDSGDKIGDMYVINQWSVVQDGKWILVQAGVSRDDDTQGMVAVTVFIFHGPELPDGGFYPTPHRSGAVHIVSVQNQRLTLLSPGGETFYFDVPGLQYTASLSDVVPSVTPWPVTPIPSITPTLLNDAPHNSNAVYDYSPINTPLHFIISHAGDEHWFRFPVRVSGTIQVHLDSLPANYDLYVYSVTRVNFTGVDGQSTNSGTTPELVTIENAPADDYMVRVVGVNGAFDPVDPYQLEIDIPIVCNPTPTPSDTASFTPTDTPTPTLTPTSTSTPTATPTNQNIQLRSKCTSCNGSGSTSLTITKLASTVAGDVMIAHVVVPPAGASITAPSGSQQIIRKDSS